MTVQDVPLAAALTIPRPESQPRRLIESRSLDLAIPVAIRVGEMIGQLLVVIVLAGRTNVDVASRFTIWDGQLYAQIARFGYPDRISIGSNKSLESGAGFAFSPLYPALTKLLSVPLGGNILVAELVLTCTAGCVFSVLVHLLVRDAGYGRRAGYLACAVVGLLPMAVVLQMGYAEALFAALSAGGTPSRKQGTVERRRGFGVPRWCYPADRLRCRRTDRGRGASG